MRMRNVFRHTLLSVAAAAVLGSGLVWATSGRGTSSVLVGPSRFYAPFKVMRLDQGEWLKIEAKRGVGIATQTITFQPAGLSGWHSHPGPVFISVKEGTMTFYNDKCEATVISANDAVNGFLDVGDDAHIAVNESGAPATNVVTYFLPPDWPPNAPLRTDEPAPAQCPIQ